MGWRVRSYLLVLAIVCSGTGLGISHWIAREHAALAHRADLHGRHAAVRAQTDHLAAVVGQWLSAGDLIAGSGQDLLLPHAGEQARSLTALALAISENELGAPMRADLSALATSVRTAQDSLQILLAAPDETARREVMTVFDRGTASIPERLDTIRDGLALRLERDATRLDVERDRLRGRTSLALAAFLLLVSGTLAWVLRQVTVPLGELTRAADGVEADKDQFPLHESGPAEIRRLTAAMNSFARDLRNHHESMEHTISTRTEQLRRSNEVKSQFIANMSHEIRTPMAGVVGTADLLLRTELRDDQRRLAKLVLTSGQSLLRLLNDILDFSKLEADAIELFPAPTDLHALGRDVVELFRATATDKRLDLDLAIEDGVPTWARTDVTRLRQALTNLVGNAVKFTSSGVVELRIMAVDPTDTSPLLRFVVRDSGPGVPAAARARIFDSFTQADGTFTREFGGTGLGLTICRQIATLLGGRVWLDETSDAGSTFCLEVPLDLCLAPDLPEEFAPPPQMMRSAGLNVLVAEDNEINQIIAREMLEELGCAVTIAPDGEAALNALARRPFDVVFLDCQMPRVDGLEVARAIRRGDLPGVDRLGMPVVALTAHAAPSDGERCLAAGMNAVLTKPFTQAQIQEALQTWALSPRSGASAS